MYVWGIISYMSYLLWRIDIMKKKIIVVGILIAAITIVSINPIRTMYYDKKYTEELQELLYEDIKDYKYVESVRIEDMMNRERYIVLEMSSDFNSLSREEKHDYLKNDLGEKLQRTYSRWVGDNKIYDNKVWEAADLTFLDIAIVINCGNQTYKYGYYEEDKYYDFVEEFVDADGTNYRFVNDKEKDEYYDNLSDWANAIGNSSEEEDYNSLTYREVTDDDTLGEVWAMAQSFVKDQLKSPKSADFPTYGDSSVSITNSGDYYKVTGYVDAENSFGAEIRSTFSLVLKKSGSKYTLKECNIY